jgi:catechol 2,3-dioxygenase-like lactoylglutathione lyase family enzyme
MGLMISMVNEMVMNHVAVECFDQDSADVFFITILGMQKRKSTVLPKELSLKIFRINTPVSFLSYENTKTRVEVFLRKSKRQPNYTHLGIQVEDKDGFIARCAQHGLKPFFVEKDGNQLLFVRDNSENLYEIKYLV